MLPVILFTCAHETWLIKHLCCLVRSFLDIACLHYCTCALLAQATQLKRKQRHLQWSVVVSSVAEGAGLSHAGWAALDIVPRQAGVCGAMGHVMARFGFGREALVVCGADAAASLAAGGEAFGAPPLGVVVPAAPSSLQPGPGGSGQLEPHSLVEQQEQLGRQAQGLLAPAQAGVAVSRHTGPAAILDGLASLGLR